jgi:dihydrofolate reductase
MGKLVVSQFITLDGVIQAPGEEKEFDRGGWAFRFQRGDEGDLFKFDEVQAAEALLLGRVTYEGFAAAWPTMTEAGAFAEKMNSMPKYVVSTTLHDPTWQNTTVIGADIPAEVGRLKEGATGDILVNGSAQLVHMLNEHDLVDEYRLMVFPLVLGAGKQLFGAASRSTAFRLSSVRAVGPDGVTILVYERA